MFEKMTSLCEKFKNIQIGWNWGAFAFPLLWGIVHKVYWPIWGYVASAVVGIALVALFLLEPAFGFFVAWFMSRVCGFVFAQIAEWQLFKNRGVSIPRDSGFWAWTVLGVLATIIRLIWIAVVLNGMNHLPVV